MSKPTTPAPLRLGLTGGIGSGKSTVAKILADLGAGVVDADAISRATTASGGAAIASIQAQFGADFIGANGALQRERMRQHIFSDTTAKARLEAIIHPLVGQAIAAQAQALSDAGHACIVFDIPLLVESGHWRKRLQRVLVVDCSAATQISRVTTRSSLPEEQVQAIMASQATRQQRLAASDMVLYNDGITLRELTGLVQQMAPRFGL